MEVQETINARADKLADSVRDILRDASVDLNKARCEVERIRIMRRVDDMLDILVLIRKYKDKPTAAALSNIDVLVGKYVKVR